MINPKSLRPGSVLNYDTTFGIEERVLDIDDLERIIKWTTSFLHRYSGIPITPERLEKAGFGYDRTYFRYATVDENQGCLIAVEDNGENWTVWYGLTDGEQKQTDDIVICHITHYHELQNLVFDILGIEI